MGLDEVTSFLASGNVLFAASDGQRLETRIENALEAALGFQVDAFVRTAAEVTQVASLEPFPAEALTATEGRVQVTFLRDEPEPAAIALAMNHASEHDRLRILGREWYWLPSAGISTSRLDVRAVERALGRGTTRTLNTVSRLKDRLAPD